jgi:hypothetical protein
MQVRREIAPIQKQKRTDQEKIVILHWLPRNNNISNTVTLLTQQKYSGTRQIE